MELLAEAVEPRRPRVTHIALNIVLPRERGNGVRWVDPYVSDQDAYNGNAEKNVSDHALSLSLAA
jgi:hypothetical protein